MEKKCSDCEYGRDYCCGRLRMKGYLECILNNDRRPPINVHRDSNCPNHKLKEDATGK